MTAAWARRRRCGEMALAALLLVGCYPVLLIGAGLLGNPGWVLVWALAGPVVLLVAWLMAAAVLIGDGPSPGRSRAAEAFRAAATGAAVAFAVPLGLWAVARLV